MYNKDNKSPAGKQDANNINYIRIETIATKPTGIEDGDHQHENEKENEYNQHQNKEEISNDNISIYMGEINDEKKYKDDKIYVKDFNNEKNKITNTVDNKGNHILYIPNDEIILTTNMTDNNNNDNDIIYTEQDIQNANTHIDNIQEDQEIILKTNILKFKEDNSIGMNIPYFRNSNVYNNLAIYVIPIIPPVYKEYLNNHAKVRCPNITTEWINWYYYSYLTSPKNIEDKFYYAIRNGKNIFVPTFEFKKGKGDDTGTETRILKSVTKDKLDEFIKSVNEMAKLSQEVVEQIKKVKKKKNQLFTWAIISIIIGLIFFLAAPFSTYMLFIPAGLLTSIFIVLLSIGCTYDNYNEIYSDENYFLVNLVNIEALMNKWNDGYFISHGIYVTCPKNFNYIQFNVDIYCRILIENHKFPSELVERDHIESDF